MQITYIVNKEDLLMQVLWAFWTSDLVKSDNTRDNLISEIFATPVSLLHGDMRIFDIEGARFTPADGQDSFLCCYLSSKITRPPTQYPLLFPPRGKQVARGPHVRLSGCISISRPSLITEIDRIRQLSFLFICRVKSQAESWFLSQIL